MKRKTKVMDTTPAKNSTPAKSSGPNKLLFGLSDTQQMMFAFGDSRRPNIETAKIVESFVLAQITEIVHETVKASHLRGFKMIQLESIVFLMRGSPLKIQRLIRYLSAKEIAKRATKVSDGEVEENKKKTLMTRCKEFIESIDDTGTLLAACNEQYFDEFYHERLLKNDRITKSMDAKKYEEFCKARVVGFRGSYSVKFQAALEELYGSLDLKVEKIAQEVIAYLAYETLGQLVGLCLVLRRDAIRDPVSRVTPALAVNTEYPSIHIPEAGAGDTKAELPGHPITPAEVREVIRRLQQTAYTGQPLSRGARYRPVSTMPLIAI